MVLILDGNSEIIAYLWSDLGYLICLTHLFRSSSATNMILYFRIRPFLRYTCTTCSELPSSISTMVVGGSYKNPKSIIKQIVTDYQGLKVSNPMGEGSTKRACVFWQQ